MQSGELPEHIRIISKPSTTSMGNLWFDVADPEHFWFRWRYDALIRHRDLLPQAGAEVLEIGCGSGVFLAQLQALGFKADGCDLNVEALSLTQPVSGNIMLYDIFERREDLKNRYQAVFLMDVIEHVADDVAFLRAASHHLKPGGQVVINVPAHPWLYSWYDQANGHARRYTPHALKFAVAGAGLSIEVLDYWGLSMVPILALRKVLPVAPESKKVFEIGFKPPGKITHHLLHLLRCLEQMMPVAPIYGTSLLLIARKT